MGEFLENIKTQNISLFVVLIFAFLAIALIVFLSGFSLYLFRRVKELSKVRYGFGGKPIFSILIVVGVAIAIPLTYYASSTTVDYVKYASGEKDVVIDFIMQKKDTDTYSVSFVAVPTVDKEPWKGRKYEVQWVVEGKIEFEKYETERSQEEPSYFTKELPLGTYSVTVHVTGRNFDVSKEEILILE